MPTTWPSELYDYDNNLIVHEGLEALDMEQGKWFRCRLCKNPKGSDGKFSIQTAFSAEQITSARGHMENKTHKDKKKRIK